MSSFSPDALVEAIASHYKIQIEMPKENGLILNFEQKHKIQIEWLDDRILISSLIGELLPSRFRDQVFLDALRSNFKSSGFGTLAYSHVKKQLVLVLPYIKVPPKEEEFIALLEGFLKKTIAWTEALSTGTTRLCV